MKHKIRIFHELLVADRTINVGRLQIIKMHGSVAKIREYRI